MAKLPCPPELWPEFSALLDQALEIPETERSRWLKSLGAEHAAVRPWLAKILAKSTGTLESDFLKRPVITESAESEFVEGQKIGPYVLRQRLGSGGMGEVWLASRGDGVINRQVALKLPHRHLLATALRRRFERERDILAGLSHPHIAQLYDAGVANDHYPYLAMEWIDGTPLNEHCQEAKLSLERRIDLFLQILDAVGYAHGRLIAHRDLKPSNILVTRDERAKLLDFGIAKLLAGDTNGGETQLTRLGSCIATPGYAAPEQLAGEPITAAVDLYALGVVLHELLTGERPLRKGSKAGGEATDVARASSRIEASHANLVGGLGVKQLRRALSGDLDAIIAKALEADPARRYRSAEAFAVDIRRSREHRPISALRISATTLTLKFVRRHWVGVAMSASLVLALIVGSGGIAWQAVRAEREAQRATTIKDFLIGVFRASDPRIAADKPRGEITARELLDVSTSEIEKSFAQEPATKIELLGVTADIYRELDETKRSAALYAQETELASKNLGAADPHAIDGLLGQADEADDDGDDDRTLALLVKADPLIRQAKLDKTAVRARWLTIQGEAMMRSAEKRDQAQSSLEAAAALFKTAAPRDPRYPGALTDLGSMALAQHRYAESAGYYRGSIDVAARNPQMEGDLLLAHAGLALALQYLGDFAGAEAAFEKGTKVAEHTFGKNSYNYWLIASDWALFRYERGERDAGLGALETLLQNLPADNAIFRNATDALEVAQVLRKYGHCLAIDGQSPRSIQLLERARELLRVSAPDAMLTGGVQLDLGLAYEAGGIVDKARDAYRTALETFETHQLPPSFLANAHEHLGRLLLSQRQIDEALREFNEALRLLADQDGETTVYAQIGLAAAALAGGDLPTALEKSRRAMDQLDHIDGFYDVRLHPYVWGIRADSLFLAGDERAALELAVRRQNAVLGYYSPNSIAVIEAAAQIRRMAAVTLNR